MEKEKNKYDLQAEEFCEKTNTKMEIKFSHYGKHFHDDKHMRDIYDIKIIRTFANGSKREYSVKFGNSIANSQYYQDTIHKDRRYTLNGGCISGNYKIDDIERYSDHVKLVPGKAPTEYSVLSCLQKYNPGSFTDFCSEFGYSEDSISANSVYKACVEEYNHLCALYNPDEMEMLQEIQ